MQYRQQRRTGTTASLAQKNYDRHLAPELSAWGSAATGLKNSAYQTAQRVKNGLKANHHMLHSVKTTMIVKNQKYFNHVFEKLIDDMKFLKKSIMRHLCTF